NCTDGCPNDPERTAPGDCACGAGYKTLWISVWTNTLADPGPEFGHSITRAIDIEVADCNGHRATTCADVAFDGTAASNGKSIQDSGLPPHMVAVTLPSCGHWTCVSVKDHLHTLQQSMPLTQDALNNVARADFVAAGLRLEGGDLNDDNLIDII